MRAFLLALSALLLSGCALGNGKPIMPYDAWFLGIGAPDYMEVWVESVDVIDQQGLVFEEVTSGIASLGKPANGKGKPAGWPTRVGSGAGKHLRGIDLPEFLFVRWQSLVEPQTYHAKVIIPQWVRDEMVKPKKIPNCARKDKDQLPLITEYHYIITLGLAPGGIVKVWLTGDCLDPIEIGRFVGEVHKEGPYGGTSNGQHRPLSDVSKAYVEKNGIPYGSW